MAVKIRSYNEILGDMIRKIIADTPLNDIHPGSALMTLFEAAAQSDFENNASILNILELLNIDALRDNDLDARAQDFGITRTPAQKATGRITIKDSSISKRSTGLYQVKPPPIAGATQIHVNNAADWAATGQLFIGRGTPSFEGPISYTSIINNGTFYTIILASALEKDHLVSDVVVDVQGTTDRLIPADTIVEIPANNQSPAIQFATLRDAVIPSGEDTIKNVSIVAKLSGSSSNAGINTITAFVNEPFPGATVTNTAAITNGRDAESNDELRERIKSYAATLARGTEQAILAAIIGVSDPNDGKQVVSATITEPPQIGDPAILYVDDGTGFQPSFNGQSVDTLLSSATGSEEFLQLANFPLPRSQVINTVDGPFEIKDGMSFRVAVDGVEESIVFSDSLFLNPNAATVAEIIIAINDQAKSFKATFTNDSTRILLYPSKFTTETIQVAPIAATEDPKLYANNVLKFPTTEISYIRLYKNNILLNERERAASLLTNEFSSWNITTSGNLILQVDGTPPQDVQFTTADFEGRPFNTLELKDWATAFNNKFAGINATATSSDRLQITSNRIGKDSALAALGGTFLTPLFNNQDTTSTGKDSDFQLNRQTGNIRILTTINQGDTIEAGTANAKGRVSSFTTPTGTYNVSVDAENRPAELVAIADADDAPRRTELGVVIGNTITITDQGSDVMRIMSDSASSFAAAVPGDYIFIVDRGGAPWVDSANTGIYRIISKGAHTTPNTDTYVEVKNFNIVPGSHVVVESNDIQVFSADAYPQLWKGSFTSVPASAPIQDIVSSFKDNLINISARIFKTNSVELSSTTEFNGSIALAAGSGNALLLFNLTDKEEEGNLPHIANKVPDKDAVSLFKRTTPTKTDAGGVSGRTIWLDRVSYSDIHGAFTASIAPGKEGVDTYSEELTSSGILNSSNVSYDDLVNFIDGANRLQYRSIRDILAGDKVGTQHALPRTLMDVSAGDRFNLMRPLSISPEDSIVFIIDNDAVNKTIDVKMSRTGQINSDFPPTDISFSANDVDNEPGVTFGNLQAWSKTANNTEFKDYTMWFRARNWYVSGGAGSGGGSFMVRAKEYGPHGENIRFQLEYPTAPDLNNSISHINNADYTLVTYRFGSNSNKPVGLTAGDTFSVSSLGNNQYRMNFNSPLALSGIVAGDVIHLGNDSGVTANNRGTFSILAVNDTTKTIDIYNPNGVVTPVGNPEVTQVSTIADVVGSPEIYSIDVNGLGGAALDGLYFIIEDTNGTVAVWFDTDNSGTAEPSHGASRSIEINPAAAASSNTVASLIAGALQADAAFTATAVGDIVTITNTQNGNLGPLQLGTSGFLDNGGTDGSPDVSLDGRYFILQDKDGSVAFWYNVSGSTSEPLHGADRSVQISTVVAGDSANTVATKTGVIINSDAQFSTTVLNNDITVTDAVNGVRPAASAGTSGFTVTQITAGVDDVLETITQPSSVFLFALKNTSVADIVSKISESPLLVAATIDDTNPIIKATREDVYTPAGPTDYSASLSYLHNPDPLSGLNSYVSLHDSQSWVKVFENSDPQFTLKKSLVLHNKAPLAYKLDTTPNEDGTNGELFKLVPTTLNNIYHHFTQKALSQLPIISDVSISNNIRRVQVVSKQLGSDGVIEVVGGNANSVDFSIFGDGQLVVGPVSSTNMLKVNTRAFPVALTKGDIVEVKNSTASKRASRLKSSDTIDVNVVSGNNVEYAWNPRKTNLLSHVNFTVTDVSATYGRAPGIIWRWTHNDGGSTVDITDKNVGTVATPPDNRRADGLSSATALDQEILDSGSATTAQRFLLKIKQLPLQGDYYTFESQSGVTFAAWFDVDGNGTPPTGATYVSATNKIQVSILSSDTEDQVTFKLITALQGDAAFVNEFNSIETEGANFDDVEIGDILVARGPFGTNWPFGNVAQQNGDNNIGGLPIINVDATNRFIDVVNPHGAPMSNNIIDTGTVNVYPTPLIKWRLAHHAQIKIVQMVVSSGVVTVTTETPHNLHGSVNIVIGDSPLAQTVSFSADSVNPQPLSFTFNDTTGTADGTYLGGTLNVQSRTRTRYAIESLGFNNLFRLQYIDGESPRFLDCGVAVDDKLIISGNTFAANNRGEFKVLAVDDTSIIFENKLGIEELNTLRPFNNSDAQVTWVANSDTITGVQGAFSNLQINDWVKKKEDDDTQYVNIVGFLDALNAPTTPANAVKIKLGSNYDGTSSISEGIAFNQLNDVGKGVFLDTFEDIEVIEGDSVRIGDILFVDSIADSSWFTSINSGSFEILAIGTDAQDKPIVRVNNASAVAQTGVSMGVSDQGFFLLEGPDNIYSSLRVIEHAAINDFDQDKRSLYMTPATRIYKISETNGTKITPIGKLGYTTDITTGIDGYLYYTGLMRTVQRIVDGFEPDIQQFPGRRAVGGLIESLPPLIARIKLSLDITTNEGVNLNEISNNIKSAIIDHVRGLNVGQDVILSEIIVTVMGISGVAAVTFNIPSPGTERISIDDNEKAFIQADDISIA